jgi:hypothetical protein
MKKKINHHGKRADGTWYLGGGLIGLPYDVGQIQVQTGIVKTHSCRSRLTIFRIRGGGLLITVD